MMKNIFRLIRWQNLLMAAVVMWLMEKMVVTTILDNALFGEQLPGWCFYLLMLSVVLLAAGGYAINDYFDTKIDVINRPDRQVVGNGLTKRDAMLAHQIMTALGVVAGLVVAIALRSWTIAIVIVLVPGLLWFYSASYKRQFIIGNLLVALLAAMVPMIVAVVNGAYLRLRFAEILPYTNLLHDIYIWVGGFASFAFLCTLIREVEKDLQDQSGDREMECHTLPIVIGDTWTKVILTILWIFTAATLCYINFRMVPFAHDIHALSTRYLIYGLLVPIICNVFLLWHSKIATDYRQAQLLTKFIMLIGVCYSIVLHFLLQTI